MGDYRREVARSRKIQSIIKGGLIENLSISFFEQLWDGSDQVVVSIRNLKDGFKSLDADYFSAASAGSASFRDEYAKQYGHAAWDARVKILDNAIDKSEQYIMKLRKDLSSQ